MIILKDFYAEWCGPCQAMKPVFERVMKDYEGKISLEKVDVDVDQMQAMKYGVMSIPTMIVEKDQKEIDRKIGMIPEPMFRQWLDSLLTK
jgi:thioredoxin 1